MQLRTSKIFHVMLYQQKREADTSLENTRFAREHNRFCERTQIYLQGNAKSLRGNAISLRENAKVLQGNANILGNVNIFERKRKR